MTAHAERFTASDGRRTSPENSRTMKEKSHRAKRRCYRSGVWTLRGTHTRRLDGHSLYNAQRAQGPRDFQADHRAVRSAPRQLRWRRDSDQGGRRPTRADVAVHAPVLRAWRHGEPVQGTAAGAGHGPHELLPLRRQPASAVVLRRGLRPVPGLAGLRPRRGRRRGAGLDATRALTEGRRVDRALGATHTAALPASLSVAGRLAATRAGTPRDLTPRADWPAVPKTDVSLAQRRDDHPCDRRGRSLTPRCRHRRPARSFRRTNSQPSARWSRRALGRVHS